MTRINVGIPPAELVNQHLIAEHREIKRIPNCVAKGKYNMDGIPDKFKLVTGHVKFFYNKLLYLKNRYISLYNECIKRGFNVQNYIGAWDNVPQEPFEQPPQCMPDKYKDKCSVQAYWNYYIGEKHTVANPKTEEIYVRRIN